MEEPKQGEAADEQVVTPWVVQGGRDGLIDYDKLISALLMHTYTHVHIHAQRMNASLTVLLCRVCLLLQINSEASG